MTLVRAAAACLLAVLAAAPAAAGDLVERFEKEWAARRAAENWSDKREAAFQKLLGEMIAERGLEVERALAADLEPWTGRPGAGAFTRYGNLERIAALRRVQGRPDPLGAEIAGATRTSVVFPELPVTLSVTLRNRDELPLDFTHGGDYRSGRQARFRIEVRDSMGATLPAKTARSYMGGGIVGRNPLAPGKSWSTDLALGSFIAPPVPGTYTVRVLYHDSVTIADSTSIEGMMVFASEPFELVVEPRRIELTRAEHERAEKLARSLEPTVPVQVIAGTYDPVAHATHIPPDSAAGKLLLLRWRAVPVLREAVLREGEDPVRRAWLLALLYSATGLHDPRADWFQLETRGILGAHEWVDAPWRMTFREGEEPTGGVLSASGSGTSEGKIDPAMQKKFAEKWRSLEGAVVVDWKD